MPMHRLFTSVCKYNNAINILEQINIFASACFKSLIKTLMKQPDFKSGLVQVQEGEQVSAHTGVNMEGAKAHHRASAKSQEKVLSK